MKTTTNHNANTNHNALIVTRHPGAVEWLRRRGVVARVLAEVGPADVHGRVVFGNIPLYLAALTEMVYAIEFAGAPPRGAEYSAEDMDAAGASLAPYRVQSLTPDDDNAAPEGCPICGAALCEEWPDCGHRVETRLRIARWLEER